MPNQVRNRKPKQQDLPFKRWGGKRKGAGRKPLGKRPGTSHRTRPAVTRHTPVHVTLRLHDHVWNLRTKRCFRPIRSAIDQARERFGCRIVHYAVQRNHIHIIAEASDDKALSRAMQGLCVRLARRLNKVMGKRGQVFADRYHDRVLKTPQQTRAALSYVLRNDQKHGFNGKGRRTARAVMDPFSTAPTFDGWRQPICVHPPPWLEAHHGAKPRCWLLLQGWKKKGGLLDPRVVPGRSKTPSNTAS